MLAGWQDKLLQVGLALAAIAIVVALVVFVIALLERWRTKERRIALVFAGPALLLLAVGLVYPMGGTALMSLYDGTQTQFVGLDNYKWIFTDPAAVRSLLNTLIWLVVVPVASTGFGFLYALLIDGSRFERFTKTLMFMPMAISFVGASIIWKFVYAYRDISRPQIGLLNQLLVWLGQEPRQFLIDSPWNTLFLIVVMIWTQTGYAMVLLSAAIKAMPVDVVEAARLDGAGGLRMLTNITIPLVRPTLVVVFTTIAIGSLKVFDIVRTMTGGQYDTQVIANTMYDQSFRYGQPGIGSAIAVLLLVMVAPVIAFNVHQLRRNREVRG
ncbi:MULTISPECIES: carbohydrate ABC transporter permease [Actinomyces]|uniref:carbohydrate ABC transporter permease n=1 Tax=Actinomyces TaxID=1654 RepID=UPI000D58DF30|nr:MULTISPECIES: sugar ABC transporter permease [Actinomyces]RAX21920.1 sugar ABC transporter permease [Actinomyces sp. Z3]